MIKINFKDGTEISGEVNDVVIFIEGTGSNLSDYMKPPSETHWILIMIPMVIYITINIGYIFFRYDFVEDGKSTYMALFLFISFISLSITTYFVHQKHKSASLSIGVLLTLILISGANSGFISYSALTHSAMEKAESLTK